MERTSNGSTELFAIYQTSHKAEDKQEQLAQAGKNMFIETRIVF